MNPVPEENGKDNESGEAGIKTIVFWIFSWNEGEKYRSVLARMHQLNPL
jgi:hypothetical protein